MNIKPIVLDLQNTVCQTVFHDVMTSSKCGGKVSTEIARIKNGLQLKGFNVLRTKVETSPFYKLVPKLNNSISTRKNQYFESHIRVITHEDQILGLRKLVADKAHVSRNIFKKLDNNEVQILLTIRKNINQYEPFKTEVDKIMDLLDSKNFKTDKLEVEFVIFDSNKNHDNKWLN